MRQSLRGIWVIARREMTVRARSKAFRISTAIMLLSLILGIVIPAVAMRDSGHRSVAVVAQTGDLSAAVTEQAALAGLSIDVVPAADRAAAAALVEAGTVNAAVVEVNEIIWKSGENPGLAPPSWESVGRTWPRFSRRSPRRSPACTPSRGGRRRGSSR